MLVCGRPVLEWMAAQLGCDPPETDAAIGWSRGGSIAAGIYFDMLQHNNIFCHIASTGLLPWRLVRAGMKYAYDQLGLERITLPVEETNARCIALVEALGAERECLLRRAGDGCDVILYVLWKDNRFRRKLWETGRY